MVTSGSLHSRKWCFSGSKRSRSFGGRGGFSVLEIKILCNTQIALKNGGICFPGFAGGSGTPADRLAAARRLSSRAILYLVVRSPLMIDDAPSI